MLWIWQKTNPPPGANVRTLSRTWASTSSRRALRQDALGVAAAAPEGQVAAELALEPDRVHAAGARLHGIDDLDPGLDEVGQDVDDRAAGMKEDVHAATADALVDDLLPGLEDLAVEAGRDHRGLLGAEVVAHLDDLDVSVDGVEEEVEVGEVHLDELVEE